MRKNNKQMGRKPRPFNRSSIFRPKPKCPLLSAGITEIDYKDLAFLRRYVNEEWKICPGRINNLSARMQRQIKNAIKRARYLSFMPYTEGHYIRRGR